MDVLNGLNVVLLPSAVYFCAVFILLISLLISSLVQNDLAYVARSSLVYDLQLDTIVLVIQFHCN